MLTKKEFVKDNHMVKNNHKWPTYDHYVLKWPLIIKMADKAIGKNLLKSFNEDQKWPLTLNLIRPSIWNRNDILFDFSHLTSATRLRPLSVKNFIILDTALILKFKCRFIAK